MLTVEWRSGKVRLIDQTKLPLREEYLEFSDYRDVAEAIKTMKVRGAPAIGVAAALGYALGAQSYEGPGGEGLLSFLAAVRNVLGSTRPTAVNLFWALERMDRKATELSRLSLLEAKEGLVREALDIQNEDIEINQILGRHGADLIEDGDNILTHCNAGALACAAYGTALGVIGAAHQQGKSLHVWVDETRPLLQGARLTAWELGKASIPHTLITDNMSAYLMAQGKVDKVVVGADRIASNGDTANKIGTYSVACLANAHRIPFYVAAPTSTIDRQLLDGAAIPIEERDASEVRGFGDCRWASAETPVYNPAFDVTPARLITAIITEQGILRPPFLASIEKLS